MERTLVTSSPLGGRAEEGGQLVVVHPVLCPLQATTFVSLTNDS